MAAAEHSISRHCPPLARRRRPPVPRSDLQLPRALNVQLGSRRSWNPVTYAKPATDAKPKALYQGAVVPLQRDASGAAPRPYHRARKHVAELKPRDDP